MVTAKEYLEQVKKLEKKIEADEMAIARLRSSAEKITTAISGMPGGSGNGRSLEDSICRLVELTEEYNTDLLTCEEIKKTILKTIERLQTDLFTILYYRYFRFFSFEEIAIRMNYTYQWICELHGRALSELDKILKEKIIKKTCGGLSQY